MVLGGVELKNVNGDILWLYKHKQTQLILDYGNKTPPPFFLLDNDKAELISLYTCLIHI